MKKHFVLPLLSAAVIIAGCGKAPEPSLSQNADGHQSTAQVEFQAEQLSRHIQQLASDAFLGRQPGTEGETLTVDYLVQQFQQLGLQAGNDGSFTQAVPYMQVTNIGQPQVRLTGSANGWQPQVGTDIVVSSRTGQTEVNLSASDIMFAGYGVVAPEYQWHDFAALDAKGKTVIVLVNDPGFASKDPALFKGEEMTYYGRWTYKYEECARQQAAACLIVHDTAAAGYGFNVVQNMMQRAQFDLANNQSAKTPVIGWLSTEGAEQLFASAGLDFQALKTRAAQPGFQAVALEGHQLSASIKLDVQTGSSNNVLAALPGKSRADEWLVVTAHWDHLGAIPKEDGALAIYNGAIDNAGGVAALLAIAEQAVAQGGFERSVLFLVITLEESGLLGTKHYVANPTVPLAQIVANINIDALLPVPETRDIWIIGLGQSELDDVVRSQAAKQQRVVIGNPEVEKGFFYRSDQFAFAQVGIPGLFMGPGTDSLQGGKAVGEAALQATQARYHTPDDIFTPDWDFGALLQDTQLHYLVLEDLANSGQWPNWSTQSEFYQLGQQLRQTRQ